LNYLINGTSSIVGNNIAKFIIQKKKFIYCYYNKIKPKNLKSNYSLLKKNNFEKIYSINKKVDCLVFCAIDKSKNYTYKNITFLKKLCNFIKLKKIDKVIYISTMAVYGVPKKTFISEKTRPRLLGKYGKIKLKQEKILKQLSINSHCQVTVLRLPGVAGKKRTGIFLSNILDKVKKNEILSYKNPKANFNNLIYEKDLAEIVYKISKNKKKYKFEVFNLGSTKPILLRSVVKRIRKHFNHSNSVIETNRNGKSFVVDTKKFEKTYFKLKSTSNSLNNFIKCNS
tara:strand:- start:117 stop:968 length:852 start_codon:yes stop_codon:yes gene_type:complete